MASPAGARNPLAIALDVHHQGPPREGSDEPREPVAVSIRYRHFVHDQWEQLLGEQLLEAPDLSSHARQSQWRFQPSCIRMFGFAPVRKKGSAAVSFSQRNTNAGTTC